MQNSILINTSIYWQKIPSNERYFYMKDNGKIVLLRINNFPDEPLYTLINGIDIIDIEDKPSGWRLELLQK